MPDFKLAIAKTLAYEGGYNNVAGDAGGETNFGISKRAYPNVDIKNLTFEKASAIYERDYWKAIGCDQLISQEVAESLFDCAVNMGVSRAAKLIQTAEGVNPDGIIGKQTISAINIKSSKEILPAFTLEKVRFYANICNKDKSQTKFLLGWLNRSLK